MSTTRREFTTMLGAAVITGLRSSRRHAAPTRISLLLAPSNLGLRPEGGRQPGTWRAPEALMDAGLADAVGAAEVVRLERPNYQAGAQAGTRTRNGHAIRAFSLQLSGKVRDVLRADRFPLVVGGDCSVLLGSLHGMRLAGGKGLVHVDGHSDFSHPGNYDSTMVLGAAAGMDLALASGRGEPLLTSWPQVGMPLASDADVVQVGERNSWGRSVKDDDAVIEGTQIRQLTIEQVLAEGVDSAARRVIARLEARDLGKAWLHVDFDVLDAAVMPAVDSPGSPGLSYEQLAGFVGALRVSGRIAGANFAIYDPERDPGARHAPALVHCIAAGIRGAGSGLVRLGINAPRHRSEQEGAIV